MSEFNEHASGSVNLRFDERKLLEQFINEAPKLHKMIVILFLVLLVQTAVFFVGAKETKGIFFFLMASSLGIGLLFEMLLGLRNLKREAAELLRKEDFGVKVKGQYKMMLFTKLYVWRSEKGKRLTLLAGVPLFYLLTYLSSFLVHGSELFAPKGDVLWFLTISICFFMTVYSMKVSYCVSSMVPGYMESKYKTT